jgi:hypothetical protein
MNVYFPIKCKQLNYFVIHSSLIVGALGKTILSTVSEFLLFYPMNKNKESPAYICIENKAKTKHYLALPCQNKYH